MPKIKKKSYHKKRNAIKWNEGGKTAPLPKKVVNVETKDKEEKTNDGIDIVFGKKFKEVGVSNLMKSTTPNQRVHVRRNTYLPKKRGSNQGTRSQSCSTCI